MANRFDYPGYATFHVPGRIECPSCGVPAGKACVTKTGKTTHQHKPRLKAQDDLAAKKAQEDKS